MRAVLLGSTLCLLACGSDVGSAAHAAPPDAPGDGMADGGAPGVTSFERACGSFRLRVTVLDDAVVRFHYIHRATEQPERGWFLELDAFAGPTRLAVEDTPERLRIGTAALSVEVAGPNCGVVIRDSRHTRVVWGDGGSFAASGGGAVELSRALSAGDRIFGLGEKTGAADRRGRRVEMWNSDPVWTDPMQRFTPHTDPLYQSHPFFLTLSAD